MNQKDTTVVICCAGMGKRLGIGTPKALLNIEGKPLIIRQLELLDDYDDVRIVVGYKAEDVIKIVLSYRKDVMFVFNYKFESTSMLDSLKKAALKPRKYILEIDGDILINREDMKKILEYPSECIGCAKLHSCEPICVNVDHGRVTGFSQGKGDYEWTGLAKLLSTRPLGNEEFMYLALESQLPIDCMEIRARDIDTQDDYIDAMKWYKDGCRQ